MSGKHVVVSAAVAGLVVLSGCGQSTTTGVGAPARIVVAAAQQDERVSVNAVEVDGLGTVLADQDGMTLYRFDSDTADPPVSNCDGDCASVWPPVVTDGEVDVSGVDRGLVGSVTRADGRTQVTVGGWPVYRFAKDTAPGEARGQGVANSWYAITPTGGKAGAPPVRIVAEELPGFGPALTDQNGLTLYLFTEDDTNPPRSVCRDECARMWPPVLVEGARPELAGVDPTIVDDTVRDDGTRQVTVGGWPVYRYAEDTAPGQTNGHGTGGTWFVVEPAGCRSDAPVRRPARTPGDGY